MKKGAIEVGTLGTIILILVGFLVVGSVTGIFVSKLGEKEAEIVCHDSILIRVKTALELKIINKDIFWTPVACKTINKEIKGDKEKIQKEIAELMARCWWMLGEGLYEEHLGGGLDPLTFFGSLFPNTKNQCFICYSLLLDPKKGFEGISVKEMTEYLYNHNYSKANLSYLEYIQTAKGLGRTIFFSDISAGKGAYGLGFAVKNKKETSWGRYIAAGVIAVGAGVVAILSGGTLAPVAAKVVLSIAAGYTGAAAYNEVVKKLTTEREVSTIFFDRLDRLQTYCQEFTDQ